jgi:glycosyltransferase involved in cell wall biosynthesis
MCGYTPPCVAFVPKPIEDLPESFYLLVGVIKQRKNKLTAVKAFVKIKEKGSNSHLVITGKGGGRYYDEVMDLINNSPFKDNIHYLGYCSDEEMVTLYQQARALIFPSLVEGFGMPIVEAMSCGTPVIASSHPSIVEAGEDAALFSDPSDVQGFAEAMIKFEDDSIRQFYIEKGFLQAKKFSWKRSASDYLSIVRDLQSESVS